MKFPLTLDALPPAAVAATGSVAQPTHVVDCRYISEHSEFKLIGNDHAETALQNGRGPDQMSGGDAELGADEERRCQCRNRSRK